jgi:hypothetical protein
MRNFGPTAPDGHNGNGRHPTRLEGVENLTLVEAAQLIERLQNRAAHERELEALRTARDALLIIVSEGCTTLAERLHPDAEPAPDPEPVRPLAGGSTASFRAVFSPHR